MPVDSSLCGITHLYPHWRFSSQPSTASIFRGNIWNYSFLFYLFKKSTKGRVCICKIVDHFISFVKAHWHSTDILEIIYPGYSCYYLLNQLSRTTQMAQCVTQPIYKFQLSPFLEGGGSGRLPKKWVIFTLQGPASPSGRLDPSLQ